MLLSVAAAASGIGAPHIASASTSTIEPAGTEPAPTDPEHTMDTTAVTLTVDGSAEPTSPEVEAFCAAEVAAEAAYASQDPAALESANESLIAAAPDEVRDTVEAVLATLESGGPEFDEAYATLIDYMKANCGFAELDVAASEYQFAGLPSALPAGPTIITLDNVGEELHEIWIARINADVTLSAEDLAELPEDELHAMVTPVAIAFTFPGATGYGTVDLTPGRYVAMCFLPEGATPETMIQLEEAGVDGPEGTLPEGIEVELGPPHSILGMIHEFTVA
jgi:hypothetical protein